MIGIGLIFFMVATLFASEAKALDRFTGLVEVPVLNRDRPQELARAVHIFAEPSTQAKLVAVIRDWKQLEYRSVTVEDVAAVVYEYKVTSNVWFMVRYFNGTESSYGWLNGTNAGKFSWYSQIVKGSMTYFTDAWDKRLYQRPNVQGPSQHFPHFGKNHDVTVAHSRGMGKDLWFLVVIIEKVIVRLMMRERLSSLLDGYLDTRKREQRRSGGMLRAEPKHGCIDQENSAQLRNL